MPGIAGIITRRPREQAAEELRRMIASIRHEPFYESGTWMDEGLGVYVGWVEMPDPGRGAMPQQNETAEKILIFSGNEFSAPRAAERLRDRGHQVENSNLAHLIHMAEEDADFPVDLNGQFHGLLADRARGTVLLFNDRYAARRLYIHEAKDGFYFAAEAKALLAVKPELRSVSERGLGELVSCGCVLEDRTLFNGVDILPCAAAWKFRDRVLEKKAQYFSTSEWEEQEPLDDEPYYQAVRQWIEGRLPQYFRDADRIGMSLTGGLDTRVIMAWRHADPGTLPCYTFGGGYQECRDVQIARKVAQNCLQPYQVIPVAHDYLKNFPYLAERAVFLTDGNATVLQSYGLFTNRKAREIAPVRMTGNFGDEMLRRWVAFRPSMPADGVFQGEFLKDVALAAETYKEGIGRLKPAAAATRQISWHFYAMQALETSQVEMRTPFLDNQLIRTVYRGHGAVYPTNDVRVRLIRDGNSSLARIRTDLGYGGSGGKTATAFWHLFHRATMRAEYACEHADPQWLAWVDQRLLGRQLERRFVGLHKFTHFSLWYRGVLAAYVKEILLDTRTLKRPYLNAKVVQAVVQEHVTGKSNHTPTIHKLLTLEHFHRLFVDAT